MSFMVLRPDSSVFEVDLQAVIEQVAEKYFPEVKPITSAEFVSALDGPSRFLPQLRKIEVKECFSPFLKVCSLLVLHELIHSKLYEKRCAPQSDTGEEFQAEVRRLWEQGAYKNLL